MSYIIMTDRQELAQAITSMSYGDLKDVGSELASICKGDIPKSAIGFADLLYDWANRASKKRPRHENKSSIS